MTEYSLRVVVERMDRIANSRNGNPRFRVHWAGSGGHAVNTASDAAFVGALTRMDGGTDHLLGEWMITLNGRGTIVNMERIPDTRECRRCGKTLPRQDDEELRRINILWNHKAVGPCRMTETEMCQ